MITMQRNGKRCLTNPLFVDVMQQRGWVMIGLRPYSETSIAAKKKVIRIQKSNKNSRGQK